MDDTKHNLLLADDDVDDRIFFKEALDELPVNANLITVNNGVKLMQFLTDSVNKLPDMLFLDLNMPLKTGYECLVEIKLHPILKLLPVIIFSTSFENEIINVLHEQGAHYYVRKPAEFSKLKQVIHKAITLITNNGKSQPLREHFMLGDE